MEDKRDIRLYEYAHGTLLKVGRNKLGRHPHLFESVESCEEHINWLKNFYKNRKIDDDTQYLIIEYFGAYESKIVKII